MDWVDNVHGLSGHCPWTQWTLSIDSMDIVHGLSGHCPPQWTLSTFQYSSRTVSMDNVHWVHGLSNDIKVVKNGTSCSSLGTQTNWVELGLVEPVSGSYHVKCLGYDTSVRQHYKSEHWVACSNQTPLWYDWKIVESYVKPEQTTTTGIFANSHFTFPLCLSVLMDIKALYVMKYTEHQKSCTTKKIIFRTRK